MLINRYLITNSEIYLMLSEIVKSCFEGKIMSQKKFPVAQVYYQWQPFIQL